MATFVQVPAGAVKIAARLVLLDTNIRPAWFVVYYTPATGIYNVSGNYKSLRIARKRRTSLQFFFPQTFVCFFDPKLGAWFYVQEGAFVPY